MTKIAAALSTFLLAAGLAACQQEKAPQAAPAAPTPAAAPAAKAKIAPLTPEQVKVTLEPQGLGAMNAATGKFEIPVKISNNGMVALSDQTDPPVRVGVQIEASDDGSHPAVMDFVRSPLPEVAPGASQVVNVVVPVDPQLDGRRLKIELLQEGVAWFSQLGQPGVTVGPYKLCDKGLCPVAATP